MKRMLLALFFLLFALPAHATTGSSSSSKKKGVQDGYRYELPGGGHVSVDLTPNPTGGYDVRFSDPVGTTVGTTGGTAAPGGGCWSSGEASTVSQGSPTKTGGPYKVDKGKMKKKRRSGSWQDLGSPQCPLTNAERLAYLSLGPVTPYFLPAVPQQVYVVGVPTDLKMHPSTNLYEPWAVVQDPWTGDLYGASPGDETTSLPLVFVGWNGAGFEACAPVP